MLLLISNEGPLGPEWRDHSLKGDWLGHRECHVGGDFLLAYKIDDGGKAGQIIFVRARHTCRSLFGIAAPKPQPLTRSPAPAPAGGRCRLRSVRTRSNSRFLSCRSSEIATS